MENLKVERYRIHTGPTIVEQVAERLKQFMTVTCIGTENVYVETHYTPTEICDMLGFTWRLRDVVRIGF